MNLYVVILVLFIVAGIFICVREWRIIKSNKKTGQWPSVEGVIEQSSPYNPSADLLPVIKYRYQVENESYQGTLQFPPGTAAMPELSKSYIEKYPIGKTVSVFYNPSDISQSTLEPGQQKDDWLIFGIGVLTIVAGLGFLFL